MGAVLDQVLTAERVEPPPEQGRLAAAQVLINLAQIGDNLRRMAEAYEKIPACTPAGLDNHLEDLVKCAQAIISKAERLRGANK